MPDSEHLIAKKAMAYDLIRTMEIAQSNDPEKTYTVDEIEDVIRAYIKADEEERVFNYYGTK